MKEMTSDEIQRRHTFIKYVGTPILVFLMLVSVAGAAPLFPIITWSNPADITYGTALSSTQLNAIVTNPITYAPLAGTVTYTPTYGTVLNVGTYTLTVYFKPTDTLNYNSVSKSVTINVRSNYQNLQLSNPVTTTTGTATIGTTTKRTTTQGTTTQGTTTTQVVDRDSSFGDRGSSFGHGDDSFGHGDDSFEQGDNSFGHRGNSFGHGGNSFGHGGSRGR